MLLCMLVVVEGGLCLLDVLDAATGRLWVLELLDVLDVMRHVLLCMLVAVEGELCLLGGAGGAGDAGGDALCAIRYSGQCVG